MGRWKKQCILGQYSPKGLISMNTLSFMTANYVARQLNYHMTQGWGEGDQATQEYFRPIESFQARFGAMLQEVKAMGFSAIDLWGAHLNPAWASPDHIAIARELLKAHKLQVISYAIWLNDLDYLKAVCQVMTQLDIPLIGGGGPLITENRTELVSILRDYGVQYGLENHPEKNPQEVLAKIGEADSDIIGVALDTGWFGTQGYPAEDALRRLAERLKLVHLKDVKQVGAHETCRFGQGIVDIQACVRVLQVADYRGAISIEHEPELFDPTEDIIASKALLQTWLEAK
jgi:sugar phosphate isomerase/epimerase